MRLLEDTYNVVIPNQFHVPSGNVGSSFVSELSRTFKAIDTASALETKSMMAAIVLLVLFLQYSKPKRVKNTLLVFRHG